MKRSTRAIICAILPLALISLGNLWLQHRKAHPVFAQTPVYLVNGVPTLQLSGSWAAGKLNAAAAQLSSGGVVRLTATYAETLTSPATISNNNVKILCDRGATLTASSSNQILVLNGNNIEVAGCSFAGSTKQTIIASGTAPNIHDNTFTNGGNVTGTNPVSVIDLETNGATDAQIINNSFTGNGSGGGTDSAIIVANYTTNQSNNGTFRIYVKNNHIFANTAAEGIFLFNVSDANITGNVIDQNNIIGASNTASGYGIMIYNTATATGPTTREVITENNVNNTAGTAIYCQGCQYPVISDNVLTNCAQQQLATVLTVACIGINAGNTASPTSPGAVVNGNTLHTSTEHGIETSHSVGATITGNVMDGIAKDGIFISGNSDTKPTIAGNTVQVQNAATANGIIVANTTDAVISSNSVSGGQSVGIECDANAARCQVIGNQINNWQAAGGIMIWLLGAQQVAQDNSLFMNVVGLPGIRSNGANSTIRHNFISVTTTSSTPIFLTSGSSAETVEENTVFFNGGTGFGITEQAGAANNIYRRNIIVGGSSPGWSLSGTTPFQSENSFNAAISASVVSSLAIGANTVIPARMTGVQGTTGTLFSVATGSFTSGNLRKTDASGNDADGGVAANQTLAQTIGCGTTTSCGNSIPTSPRIAFGQAQLSTGAATVTGVSPAWTSTSSAQCSCTDLSTATNACQAKLGSTTSISLAGTGTDTVAYICVGN